MGCGKYNHRVVTPGKQANNGKAEVIYLIFPNSFCATFNKPQIKNWIHLSFNLNISS